MFAHLIILSLVALAYGRPEDILEDERLYVPDDRCPPAEQHYLLPHDYDCTKFYYCEYGVRYLEPRNCAPGTEFSYQLQVCIHPELANCTLPGPSTPGSSTPPTSPPSTAAPSPPSTPAPAPPSTSSPAPPSTAAPDNGTLPNGCPSDFNIDWRFPHECDCDKYYRCMYGRIVLKECEAGLHFNPVKQICELPADAGCVSGGSSSSTAAPSPPSTAAPTPPSTAAPSPPPTAAPSPPPTAAPVPSPPPVEIDRCQNECQVPHWPHETDCDKFWRCQGNQMVLGVCSEGLYFNRYTQTCDFHCNVDCVRNIVQSTAQREGLSVFVPWDKVKKFKELSKRGKLPIDFGKF